MPPQNPVANAYRTGKERDAFIAMAQQEASRYSIETSLPESCAGPTDDSDSPVGPRRQATGHGATTPTKQGSVSELERLPAEVKCIIIGHLAMPDVISLATTSKGLNATASHTPAVADVLAFAAHALPAMRDTLTIQRFSAAELQRSLRDHRCCYCEDPRAWNLYLPTGERVCNWCLSHNVNLVLVRPVTAARGIGLSRDQCARVPKFQVVPGDRYRYKARRKYWPDLMSLTHVKMLAREENGGMARQWRMSPRETRFQYRKKQKCYGIIRDTPMGKTAQPVRCSQSMLLLLLTDEDHFCGEMAAVAWPMI